MQKRPNINIFSISIFEISGLIGLGNMGSGMASNIIKSKPADSLFYDINPQSINKIPGAKAAESVKHLAASCEIIITMLPNSKHVAEICSGHDGIFNVMNHFVESIFMSVH
jgi:3-hydroxyisobutyrate dehydrogenase-like beta-hydroxyacid dehydrogenase